MPGGPLVSVLALLGSGAVLVVAGARLARVVDQLADRTGIGEAAAGALFLGAATSLPGLVATFVGALDGDAGFAVGNAAGGIAVQTAFLPLADLTYRRANLEHAAASLANLFQSLLLVAMLGVVLAAAAGPDLTVAGVHPATAVLVAAYLLGMRTARNLDQHPLWEPVETSQTTLDEPDPVNTALGLRHLWGSFAVLAAIVGLTGWVVGRSGLDLAESTGLSGTVVATSFTGVVTSLPELVTTVAAVRLGALTLAVGDIIGGNAFDMLMIAGADAAFRGSIYHAAGVEAGYVLAMTLILTAILALGLLVRQRRGIGAEGVAILGVYGLMMATLYLW